MTAGETHWQSLRRAFDAQLAGETGIPGDAPVRAEAEELLRHLQQASALIGDSSTTAPGLFAPGDLLSERYRILQSLGSGGMGHVYEAEDQLLQVIVAVKTVPLGSGEDSLAMTLLRREIRNTRRIVHSNVCRTFDLGLHRTAQTPVAFLTMERLRGETLAAHLERHQLSAAEALGLARQLCEGLQAAHRQEIVHGDLKPQNMMLVEEGRLVILDFGLSRQSAQVEATAGPLSRMCFGTPEYLAPERFAGAPATFAGDIYSLGSVLRRLAAAFSPGVDPAVAARWKRTVEACLQPNPGQRPASADAVYRLLRGARPALPTLRAALWPVAAAGLLCVTLWAVHLRARAATPAAPAPATADSVQPGAREYMDAGKLYLGRQTRPAVDHAIDDFQRTLELQPGAPVVQAWLARALMRKYELSKDPQWLDEAAKQLAPAQQHAPGLEPVVLARGVLDRERDHFPESENALHQAIALDHSDGEAWKQLALALDAAGNVLEAETAYERGIAADPSYWSLYSNFGLFLYAHGQFARAEQQMLLARSLAPDSPNVLAGLGGLYLAEGKLDLAEQTLQRALELEPSAAFSLNLGSVYLREGKTADAVRLYREACAMSPGDYRMWTNLGSGYTRLGNPGEARKAYSKANAILKHDLLGKPKDPHLWSDLAIYSALEGKPADARAAAGRALAAAPQDPGIVLKLADMEAMLEDRKAALGYIRHALELGASLQQVEGDRTLAEVTSTPAYVVLAKQWQGAQTASR